MAIQFDVLLRKLGSNGKAQLIAFSMLSFYNIYAGFNALATVFIAYSPDYRCNVPPLDNATEYGDLTEADILNYTTPEDTCYRYGYDLSECRNGSLECVNTSYPLIPCDQGYHYDDTLFQNTVITEFNLVCDQYYLNALTSSLYYVGMLIGSLFFGNIADAFGRKITMMVSALGTFGCMLALYFITSVELYIVFRVLIAMFGIGVGISTFVFLMEVVGSEWRTIYGLAYQAIFALGYMIMGGVAYRWRDWHDMMLVCALLGSPLILITIIMPESPRWLFTKGKDKRGKKVVNLMAKLNKVEFTKEDWDKAKKSDNKNSIKTNRKYSSLDLFKYPQTRIITLKVMFNWFVNSFVYYGISLNAGSLAGDIFVNNTLNGVFEIASYVFCIFLMDRIGRKILLCSMMILAGVGLILSVIVQTYAGDNQGLITFATFLAFTAKFGISGSFAVIYNLTGELYPTVIRVNGIADGSFVARIGGIIAPFFISIQDYVAWLPNTIFGVFSIVAGVLSLSFPETNGHRMMETIEEAEVFYKTKTIIREDFDKASISSISGGEGCNMGTSNKAFDGEQEQTKSSHL